VVRAGLRPAFVTALDSRRRSARVVGLLVTATCVDAVARRGRRSWLALFVMFLETLCAVPRTRFKGNDTSVRPYVSAQPCQNRHSIVRDVTPRIRPEMFATDLARGAGATSS
jgi:hypothetical protein